MEEADEERRRREQHIDGVKMNIYKTQTKAKEQNNNVNSGTGGASGGMEDVGAAGDN